MTTALLIIDMQQAILDGKGTQDRQPAIQAALEATVGRLARVLSSARNADAKVIVVQHDGGAGHRLETGSNGWLVRPEFVPLQSERLIHKKFGDAFFETTLDAVLSQLCIKRLVIGGCMTQFCIDATVRSAVGHGYDVTLLRDGHTTADNDILTFDQIIAHHNATLDGFDAGMCEVRLAKCEDVTFD
ncbi:cysteine hydrolase family protein [Asticcacaulis sp. 201]|uniref:cysteine hydrolase family protein n=1 Tax=Asticcacaulis sp. 201 TaxID=3028787 RepID=UPI002916F62D|nr:cysteine hydrolase family protein [Asticcacaulis sp. 201]MDV6329472.1 cysteine hydrolase family protein [Asticcacaulis sp. 201]